MAYYYKYHEILLSLRKEYLRNQEIIKELLSYVSITDNSSNKYSPNLMFKTTSKDKIDTLLLIVSKRQSFIRLVLRSLYHSLVDCDPDLDSGKFLYAFRLTDDFVYLLDDCQDGRYLNSKITINSPQEFIELYRLLMENVICKKGRTALDLERVFLEICNNGIHLSYFANNSRKRNIVLDYDGIGDNIKISNASHLKELLELKINKDEIPDYFRNLIDDNMDEYLYTIEGECSKRVGLYRIEDYGREIILKPRKQF